MQDDNSPPIDRPEQSREVLLSDIETTLHLSLVGLERTQRFFKENPLLMFHEEAMATVHCRDDVKALFTSVRRRRINGEDYDRPPRVDNINEHPFDPNHDKRETDGSNGEN